jgi:hypothetical protein
MKRLVWCLFPLVTACAASSPGEGLGGDDDDGGDPADAGVVDVALDVNQMPPTTVYSQIPVRGHGPKGGTLVYKTPVHDKAHADIANDGSFCVDVAIETGTTTEIEFQAIDANGNYSTPMTTSITQSGTPPVTQNPDTSEARNVLRGAIDLARPTTYRTSMWTDDGEKFDVLTDGDKNASIHMYDPEIWAWSYNWIAIHLPENASVFSAKITAATDCPIGEFAWYLSDAADPSPPDDSWLVQPYVNNYAASHALVPTTANTKAKWIAFRFDGRDCAGFWDNFGVRRISEIEVYTYDGQPGAPPPPTSGAPTCANGGNP